MIVPDNNWKLCLSFPQVVLFLQLMKHSVDKQPYHLFHIAGNICHKGDRTKCLLNLYNVSIHLLLSGHSISTPSCNRLWNRSNSSLCCSCYAASRIYRNVSGRSIFASRMTPVADCCISASTSKPFAHFNWFSKSSILLFIFAWSRSLLVFNRTMHLMRMSMLDMTNGNINIFTKKVEQRLLSQLL